MLLTLTTTHRPATDLGYLLHKSPARTQSFDLTFGRAHVFYPEATDDRCTAALLLEIDPVGLVRGGGESRTLEQYVNDRPYAASSFTSVALREVFGTALSGRCKERPELVGRAIPLEATISVVPCRGGEALLRRLFEPLGYVVVAAAHPLDASHAEWGPSRHLTVTIAGTKTVAELLTHLYVLIPVLDDDKHYWVGDDEVAKLLRHGEGWLATHPERELIANRYLKHRRSLARDALERLTADEMPEPDELASADDAHAMARLSLNELRIGTVIAALKACGAKRVLDLGCGEGRLLRELMNDRSFDEIVGVDVSHRALEIASDRLHLDRMPEKQRARLRLLQGSLTYRDRRLEGFDAAAIVEVIEHLDPHRLPAFERVVFEHARPRTVVLTTPNSEHNVKFENLPAGRFRHKDHRFEWSRAELATWAASVGERFGYGVRFLPIGPDDPVVGAPTSMVVLSR